jgi:hypothetical protein
MIFELEADNAQCLSCGAVYGLLDYHEENEGGKFSDLSYQLVG